MSTPDYPFIHTEPCPECGAELIAVIEIRPTMHPSLAPDTKIMVPTVEWLQICDHDE